MSKNHRPPPTRFGPVVQPKAAVALPATGPRHAPPPTLYGPQPAAQPKLAQAMGPATPAASSTVQMMQKMNLRTHKKVDYSGKQFDEEIGDALSLLGDNRPLEAVNVDGEDYAYYPPGSKEVMPYSRPAWNFGTFEAIAAKQPYPGGGIQCAICKKKIVTDLWGREEWTSKSGKKHYTRPPIDHHSPDWIVRLKGIKDEAEKAFGHYDPNQIDKVQFPNAVADIRQLVVKEYHADVLRIAHMLCNSGKSKA